MGLLTIEYYFWLNPKHQIHKFLFLTPYLLVYGSKINSKYLKSTLIYVKVLYFVSDKVSVL